MEVDTSHFLFFIYIKPRYNNESETVTTLVCKRWKSLTVIFEPFSYFIDHSVISFVHHDPINTKMRQEITLKQDVLICFLVARYVLSICILDLLKRFEKSLYSDSLNYNWFKKIRINYTKYEKRQLWK